MKAAEVKLSGMPSPVLLAGAIGLPAISLLLSLRARQRADEVAGRLAALEEAMRLLKGQAGSPPAPPAPAGHAPPPLPVSPTPPPGRAAQDWEQFMGVKLFAWIGGLAFFLGIAFFLKYSFEHNLIPPEMRAAIGFLVGLALVGGGLLLGRADSAVTSQTLCGTGLLVLYAVTFACRAYYHFALFGLIPTLSLMTLITALAFFLAVRLGAMAVAILGVFGGFLTPIVLHTGQDNPGVLFAYVALLDAGLLSIARSRKWDVLPLLGAAGTLLLQALWVAAFFVAGHYASNDRVFVAMAVFAGMEALFLAASAWAGKRRGKFAAAALCVSLAAMASAVYFTGFPELESRVSLVFGYALLLEVGFLALALVGGGFVAALAGLLAALALENAWYFERYRVSNSPVHTALVWFLAFYALFSVFPFLFYRKFAGRSGVWAVAALAGPLHFYMIYEVFRPLYQDIAPGLLPAALAVPPLLGMGFLASWSEPENPAREAQLAAFGGAALFFITAIFPVQFHREWVTLGWALEGAALCWLARRVRHPWLPVAGAGLLTAAFARLALNPAVLGYHPRAATPIFNWYLYAYGVVSVALFAGASLLPLRRKGMFDPRVWLNTLGTVLAFLLLNIEIADYFETPGETLIFQFSGNFARDMAYSIAWALFALVLLIIGIRRRAAAIRYGGLGLLGATLLKLFVHDLAELDQLYRVGAFIAVAVIAILALFLYQRFLGSSPPGTKADVKREGAL